MANKITLAISIIVIFGMSLIISIPIFIISTTLAPYGKIEESIPFYYKPNNSSFMKELNINTDIGEVEIGYTYEPVDYSTRVELNLEMLGSGLAEKSYFDYFDIVWQNTSGIVNFTMQLKASIDHAEVLSLIKNVNITVTLKADVICDVNTLISFQGSVDITVPWRLSIGNILVNVSKGNINYYFSNCIIEGGITGITQETGNIKLKMNDVEYKKNSLWALTTDIGNIVIEINQHITMGENITGTITTNIGNYRLAYLDSNVDVGAHFILCPNPNDAQFQQQLTQIVGFEEPDLVVVDGNDIYTLKSNDYPTLNNYNLSFSLPNGYYDLNIQNI